MKKPKRKAEWPVGLIGGMLIFALLPGCNEPEPGCLEIEAVNFAVDADRPCADCCNFPAINLSLEHKVVLPDTVENLVYEDSVYQDGAGNDFRLERIRFFLTDFGLQREDGSRLGVDDTLRIRIPQKDGSTREVVVEDNYALVDPGNFRSISIGNFRGSGRFIAIQFTLGIEGIANQTRPESFPEDQQDHPLADSSMFWNVDSGYIFNRIDLFKVEGIADTLRRTVAIGLPENLLQLSIPVDFTLDPGFNTSVTLRIDYQRWFAAADVFSEDVEMLRANIVKGLAKSFSLVEIRSSSN